MKLLAPVPKPRVCIGGYGPSLHLRRTVSWQSEPGKRLVHRASQIQAFCAPDPRLHLGAEVREHRRGGQDPGLHQSSKNLLERLADLFRIVRQHLVGPKACLLRLAQPRFIDPVYGPEALQHSFHLSSWHREDGRHDSFVLAVSKPCGHLAGSQALVETINGELGRDGDLYPSAVA